MKLRSHLLILSLATLVPMAIFSVGGAFLLAERERQAFERGVIERVRALMTAVDADLRGTITTLEALAVLPAFESDNVEALRPLAARRPRRTARKACASPPPRAPTSRSSISACR